jgi:uncharacterized membrane protein YkvA (DUF1232 family)
MECLEAYAMKFLQDIIRNIKVQAHTLWLCARDVELHWGLRVFALAIAGYALSPIDLIPDFIPILGLLDDAVLVPLGVWLFRKLVPMPIYARNLATAETASTRPISHAGAVVIVGLWMACAFWLVRMFGWI